MKKPKTENERLALILQGAIYLNAARGCFDAAGAAKTLDRTRLAISSVKGAIRNRSRFAFKEVTR